MGSCRRVAAGGGEQGGKPPPAQANPPRETRLTLQADGRYARFTVSDNGQGIPPKELPTLFDGTLRHGETPQGDGKRNMGLGLSVCRAIIRAHGGTISARNLSQGAEFTFRLPLSKEVPA